MHTSLHKVSPLGDDELVVVLQDLGVSGDEVSGLDVAHGDALSGILLGHVICKTVFKNLTTHSRNGGYRSRPYL